MTTITQSTTEGPFFRLDVLSTDPCPTCERLDGRVFTRDQVFGKVSERLNRCAFIPKCRVALTRATQTGDLIYTELPNDQRSPVPTWLVGVIWLSVFACVGAIVAVAKLGGAPQ